MFWVAFLAAVLFAFGDDFWETPVDYWKEERKTEKKVKDMREERVREIYVKSLGWGSPNVSPIEREFLKNPNDPVVRKYLKEYYRERFFRQHELASVLFESEYEIEKNLKEPLKRYVVYYFYSPSCPYCRQSEPAVRFLGSVTDVYRVNVDVPGNYVYVERFGVRGVPAFFFVDRETKTVRASWIGPLVIDRRFYDFVRAELK